MNTIATASAQIDAQLVDEMMNSRGRLLGAIGGTAIAMIIVAAVAFITGFVLSYPYVSFGISLCLFGMAAGLSMWSYGEYLYLSSVERRRREAEQG